MFRFYFLTILTYIRIILRAVIWLLHLLLHAYCGWKQFALVRLSLEEATASIHHWVLWPKSFLIFIVWINWRTLQPTSFSSWRVSHVLGSVHRLVSHVLRVVHWKERMSLHYKFNCVFEWGFNCKLELGIGILFTCNRLFW